jgi:hypothetical protein
VRRFTPMINRHDGGILTRTARRICAAAVLCAVIAAPGAYAAPTNEAAGSPGIDLSADKLEYARSRNILVAEGNVVITRGTLEELNAGSVMVNTDTGDAWASGDVMLRSDKTAWKSQSIYCNLKTGRAVCDDTSELESLPFHVAAGRAERFKDGRVIAGRARFTTCERPHPHSHYHIRAAEIQFVPGKSVSAKHVVFRLGGIPVMYLPYWKQSMDGSGLSMQPGYASHLGVFLFSSYGYGINDTLKGRTHVDYRTRRGVAIGQDLVWESAEGKWAGDATAYYAYDTKPHDNEIEEAEGIITAHRYRIRAFHNHRLRGDTYAMGRIHYLSDPDVLDDFFRSEFKAEPRPENYILVKRRGKGYVAGLSVRKRLNDFFPSVDRFPEAAVEVPLLQIGKTAFYYEGRTAAGYVQRLWPAGSTNSSYSALRLDTDHSFSTSRRVGFVNVVPSIGYRGVYYSASPGLVAGDTGGGGPRSLVEIGCRASFKAFKGWQTDATGMRHRHVAEPYMEYTFVPEPNLRTDEVYQFDEVDALDEKHQLTIGIRNKIQKKQGRQGQTLGDVNIWSDLSLDPDDESVFTFLKFDAEVRALDHMALDFDGAWSLTGEGLAELNSHLVVGNLSGTHADMEYRYRQGDRNIVSGDFIYEPSDTWTCRYNARFSINDNRMEKQTVWLQRNYDCMHVAAGFSEIPGYMTSDGVERDDEYQILFRIWLTAFPDMGISLD